MLLPNVAATWQADLLNQSPLFTPLQNTLRGLQRITRDRFPTPDDCNQLMAQQGLVITSASGKPIRFVAPDTDAHEFEQRYEPRIYLHGEVQTRENSWHDLFNALVWMTFPQTKAALNARHYTEQSSPLVKKNRSAVQDAMTLFDESGVIVISSEARLIDLLKNFEWKKLFWQHREEVQQHMRFFIFGHALYEKSLQPYAGMTGKASVFLIDKKTDNNQLVTDLSRYDAMMAVRLSQDIYASKDFSPLPLMGVPGWSEENNAESFYENKNVFRAKKSDALVE